MLTLLIGCGPNGGPPPAKTEPAHVEHHVDENHLNRVTLTEQAEQRLGIKLVAALVAPIRRTRTVGGEVMLPPGKSIVVSAPIAGTLATPADGKLPVPGTRVKVGQPLFAFTPLLTPERDVLTPAERVRVAQTKATVATAQIEAERQIESAKVTVEAAKIAHDRALQLLASRAGSQRTVDEAAANLKLAEEALTTAHTRHRFLSSIQLDEKAGTLTSRPIESPVAGVLQTLDTAVGETVAAGEPLFSVITTDQVWVRVPIYVGQWREIDSQRPAAISEFGAEPQTEPQVGHYVAAPPTANPLATTVDAYYAMENADGRLYPGQKLAVTVPLRGTAEQLVVPHSAILYDIHGGEWVYELLEPHVFARRRVSVEFVDEGQAVLERGPEPGRQVVTDGAVELFGTEFGVGH